MQNEVKAYSPKVSFKKQIALWSPLIWQTLCFYATCSIQTVIWANILVYVDVAFSVGSSKQWWNKNCYIINIMGFIL